MKKNNKPVYWYSVCKTMEIAGGHKLTLPYKSKCRNLHGHNWLVRIWCGGKKLNKCGMVEDFTLLKKKIHDRLDHKYLNDIFDFNPTAENIGRWMLEQVKTAYRVEIQESTGNVATVEKLMEA